MYIKDVSQFFKFMKVHLRIFNVFYVRYKNTVKVGKCEEKKSAKILEDRDANFLFSVTHESQITYNCFRNKTIIEELSIKIFYFYLSVREIDYLWNQAFTYARLYDI